MRMSNVFMALIIAMTSLFTVGCETVDTGHVGVVDLFGELTGEAVPEGMHLMNPFKSVTEMSIQQQNLDFIRGSELRQISAPAKDKQKIFIDATVMFYLNARENPKNAVDVRQKIGVDWVNKMLIANVRSGVRDAVAEFTAMGALEQRDALADRATDIVRGNIAAILKQQGIPENAIVLQNVTVRDVDLPEHLEQSIAAAQKQKAAAIEREMAIKTTEMDQKQKLMEQEGQTAVELEKARRRAKQRQIDADSIAKYNRIVNASLTPLLLQQKRIEATKEIFSRQGTSTVYLGSPESLLFQNLAGARPHK